MTPAAATPSSQRLASPKSLGTIVIVSLIGFFAFTVGLGFAQRLVGGTASAFMFIQIAFQAVATLGGIGTSILFAIWVYRINSNARSMGADLRFGPATAALFVALPFINYILAPFALSQTLRVSQSVADWRQRSARGAAHMWFMTVTATVLNYISFRYETIRSINGLLEQQTMISAPGEGEALAFLLGASATVAGAIASLLARAYVQRVTANQSLQIEKWNAGAAPMIDVGEQIGQAWTTGQKFAVVGLAAVVIAPLAGEALRPLIQYQLITSGLRDTMSETLITINRIIVPTSLLAFAWFLAGRIAGVRATFLLMTSATYILATAAAEILQDTGQRLGILDIESLRILAARYEILFEFLFSLNQLDLEFVRKVPVFIAWACIVPGLRRLSYFAATLGIALLASVLQHLAMQAALFFLDADFQVLSTSHSLAATVAVEWPMFLFIGFAIERSRRRALPGQAA